MPSACFVSVRKKNKNERPWSKNKINQRSEKKQTQRKIVKRDKIIVYLLSKIKNLQFLLNGYRHYSGPYPLSCFVNNETPTTWKMLTPWWPDCSHDISCHNSENWPQTNGNKLTLELKINYTWIKMTLVKPLMTNFIGAVSASSPLPLPVHPCNSPLKLLPTLCRCRAGGWRIQPLDMSALSPCYYQTPK